MLHHAPLIQPQLLADNAPLCSQVTAQSHSPLKPRSLALAMAAPLFWLSPAVGNGNCQRFDPGFFSIRRPSYFGTTTQFLNSKPKPTAVRCLSVPPPLFFLVMFLLVSYGLCLFTKKFVESKVKQYLIMPR